MIKLYGSSPESMKGRYSPAECIGARKEYIEGNPDPRHVSTSYAERQNLTMRRQALLTACGKCRISWEYLRLGRQ